MKTVTVNHRRTTAPRPPAVAPTPRKITARATTPPPALAKTATQPVVARPRRAHAALPPPVAAPLWQLRLYVTGQTPKSRTALANLESFCENYLKGRYRITVIDLLTQPHLAQGDQILAVPTVVRHLPKPVRTVIGNFSDTARVLVGLDLRLAD